MSNKRRLNLFKINPNCHWCGCLTVLTLKPGKLPNNAATVDHIISRLDPRRHAMTFEEAANQTVLACHSCNTRRNNEETKRLRPVPVPDVDRHMSYGEYQRRVEKILDYIALHPFEGGVKEDYYEGYNAAVADLKKNIMRLSQKWKLGRDVAEHHPTPPEDYSLPQDYPIQDSPYSEDRPPLNPQKDFSILAWLKDLLT